MPDEYDFKKYQSVEDFSETLEGTKYLHDLYLKAVNHPIRREILNIINQAKKIKEINLIKALIDNQVIKDDSSFNYNIDYLIKAFCVNKTVENDDIYYEITQSGQVVDYLK